jgi:hypothetical protein
VAGVSRRRQAPADDGGDGGVRRSGSGAFTVENRGGIKSDEIQRTVAIDDDAPRTGYHRR